MTPVNTIPDARNDIILRIAIGALIIPVISCSIEDEMTTNATNTFQYAVVNTKKGSGFSPVNCRVVRLELVLRLANFFPDNLNAREVKGPKADWKPAATIEFVDTGRTSRTIYISDGLEYWTAEPFDGDYALSLGFGEALKKILFESNCCGVSGDPADLSDEVDD